MERERFSEEPRSRTTARAAMADDFRSLHDSTGVKLSGAIAMLTGRSPVAAPAGD